MSTSQNRFGACSARTAPYSRGRLIGKFLTSQIVTILRC